MSKSRRLNPMTRAEVVLNFIVVLAVRAIELAQLFRIVRLILYYARFGQNHARGPRCPSGRARPEGEEKG
jgi:hypothetical protein